MAADETTLVYPGGDTRCIFSDSTPFAFQVVPGDGDKLLFYLQGGGACWDEASTKLGLCTTDASPQDLVGVFDRESDGNRFGSHTIVNVLYCSGDVHGGNVTRSYNDAKGEPVQQMGLLNAQAALDWVKQQQATGALQEQLSELVVMGCSAGSIGAQLWGKTIVESLQWKTAAIMPDSYAGLFPEGTMGPVIYEYNFCDSGFLSAELTQKCLRQELTLQDIDLEFMAATPSVPYTFIQSKVDSVQMSYYVSLGVLSNASDWMITPSEFYEGVNDIFSLYTKERDNFVTYLIDGGTHCFTDATRYFTTDATGAVTAGARAQEGGSEDMLFEWANELPLQEGEVVETICAGQVQLSAPATGEEDNTYCASGVYPNSYTEHY